MQDGRKNQQMDLVAGRLGGVSAEHAAAAPGRAKSTYDASRLGISADSPPPDQAGQDSPHPDQAGKPAGLPQRVARLVCSCGRRKLLCLAGCGVLAVCVLGWGLWRCLGAGGPKSAGAAVAVPVIAAPQGNPNPAAPPRASAAPAVKAVQPTAPPPLAAASPQDIQRLRQLQARQQAAMIGLVGKVVETLSAAFETSPARQDPPGGQSAQAVQTVQASSAAPIASTPATGPAPATQVNAAPQPPTVRLTVCPAGFRLMGIISGPRQRLANVNGEFVKVGQTVAGARVIDIRETSVEMEMNGERFILGSDPTDRPPVSQTPTGR